MNMTVGNLIGLLMQYPITTHLQLNIISCDEEKALSSGQLPMTINYDKVLNGLIFVFTDEGDNND